MSLLLLLVCFFICGSCLLLLLLLLLLHVHPRPQRSPVDLHQTTVFEIPPHLIVFEHVTVRRWDPHQLLSTCPGILLWLPGPEAHHVTSGVTWLSSLVPHSPTTGMSLGSLSGKRGGNEQHAARITVGVWTFYFTLSSLDFWSLSFDRDFSWCDWDSLGTTAAQCSSTSVCSAGCVVIFLLSFLIY